MHTAGNANSSGKEYVQQDHNIRDRIPKVVSLYEAQNFKGSIDFVILSFPEASTKYCNLFLSAKNSS